jgi:chromosomal replication initiator protein
LVPTDTSAQRTWEAALGRLQIQVPRPSFDTWLRGTIGLSLEGNTLVVGVPTPFAAEWLEKRMHGLIENAVAAIGPDRLEVAFRVGGDASTSGPDRPVEAVPVPTRAAPAPAPVTQPTLKSRYTFDAFVVGDSNHLAYAAAMAVSDDPGRAYNPLFLYAAVGLGKTHLLHAIGHRAQALGRAVAYVTCEQFTNEYLAAIRERRTEQFRARYRTAELLLIDDVQFLCGKEGTQEGFFHTFNALHDAGRQIVLTCDRPPAALPLLEERLRSRFEWGLMADIGPPSLETRTAILQRLATLAPVTTPDVVLAFIAERVPSNIRQLEGCLNRVTALAHFTGAPVTLDLASQALGTTLVQDAGESTPKAIIAAVAAHYGLATAALVSGRRDKPIAAARQLAMLLLHQTLHLTPDAIGQILGGRDRTTVLYGIKRITSKLALDPTFAEEVTRLKVSLPSTNI